MQASDLNRILLVMATALVAGWLIGNISLALFVGVSVYCMWLHRNLNRLLDSVRNRKPTEAPDPRGVFEELCREIDYLRERHKRRKKKLSTYLKQFRQATRALPDSTLLLDEHGSVKWANKAAESVLGISWPSDADQRVTNLIRDPALVEFIDSNEENTSIDLSSPVDPKIQLNIRVTRSGNRQRLLVARDMTQLHYANKVRSDFVANVSHELRTPITVLKGYLENMNTQRDRCPPGWLGAMEQMTEHVGRMQAVVEDLLMLSKLEQNDRIDDAMPVQVAELIADIHRQSRALRPHSDHIFSFAVDTDLAILGSGDELRSCFSNLIFNAVHYTNERGVIEVRWYRDAEGAHFAVRDNGIGIGAEHISRLTERFYRADVSRARSYGGTGLGLAIVKHILNRHRALLHIESELGVGSLFRCDFPADLIVESDTEFREINETA